MIDNDVLVAAADATIGTDYGSVWRSGVVALFYADGAHRASVRVASPEDADVVAAAGLGPAVGADQSLWVSGVVRSETMDDSLMDPSGIPAIAYLAARRDLMVAFYRRDLSMADDGTMTPPCRPDPALHQTLSMGRPGGGALDHGTARGRRGDLGRIAGREGTQGGAAMTCWECGCTESQHEAALLADECWCDEFVPEPEGVPV